ncbi:MAG: hypothetical protein Q9221_006991 [Calogaya cf. arnoldii]
MVTETATALRSAWAEVLDVDLDEITDDSNFISLGGDSVQAMKLAEIAPHHGLDISTEAIFQEGVFSKLLARTRMLDSSSPAAKDSTKTSVTTDEALIENCADACSLPPDEIEDIYPPSPIGAWFFTSHQESGAWLLQIVFELQNGLDMQLVTNAFEAIYDRNATFRSRFAIVNDGVQTIVTNTPVKWHHATNLEEYKAEDRSLKVRAGQPAIRYGLIREPDGGSYVVWTALHAVMDGWTRKLLCDDLEAYLADPEAFVSMGPRPNIKLYLEFIKTMDPAPSRAFWSSYLSNMPAQNPIKGSKKLPADAEPVCNQKIIYKFSLSKTASSSTIRLSTIAHAAFAILLGDLTSTSDVFFLGLRASRTIFPGAHAIMGSVFSAVPIRIRFSPDEVIGGLLARVQDESNAMMRHEPFGGEARHEAWSKLEGKENHSLSFQWYPKGTDLFERRMVAGGGDERRGRLRVVEEKYSPHTFPGGLNAFDDGDSVRVQSEFDDRIFQADIMKRLIARFARLLERMRHAEDSESIGSLLAELES